MSDTTVNIVTALLALFAMGVPVGLLSIAFLRRVELRKLACLDELEQHKVVSFQMASAMQQGEVKLTEHLATISALQLETGRLRTTNKNSVQRLEQAQRERDVSREHLVQANAKLSLSVQHAASLQAVIDTKAAVRAVRPGQWPPQGAHSIDLSVTPPAPAPTGLGVMPPTFASFSNGIDAGQRGKNLVDLPPYKDQLHAKAWELGLHTGRLATTEDHTGTQHAFGEWVVGAAEWVDQLIDNDRPRPLEVARPFSPMRERGYRWAADNLAQYCSELTHPYTLPAPKLVTETPEHLQSSVACAYQRGYDAGMGAGADEGSILCPCPFTRADLAKAWSVGTEAGALGAQYGERTHAYNQGAIDHVCAFLTGEGAAMPYNKDNADEYASYGEYVAGALMASDRLEAMK